MRNLISMRFSRRCCPILGAMLASVMLVGCAPTLRLAVEHNAAAEKRVHEQRKVVQHFPVQENENVRGEIMALITVPPGRGMPDFCARAHNVRTKQSACLDDGGMTQPVRFAMPYDSGSKAIKLLVYLRSDNVTTFHLVRVDTQTKRERFLTQWDTREPLEETYNKTLSISPDGKQVAIVKNALNMRGASHIMKQGELSLYDLESDSWRALAIDALDGHPVQWLDAERIVFARAVKRDDVPAHLITLENSSDEFGVVYSRASFVPLIYVRNLRTNSERAIHVGRIAIAAPSGRELIVQDDARKLRRVLIDGDSYRSTPLSAPPMMTHDGVIGFASAQHVLYWSEPFAGRELQYTLSNSPLVGPKKLLSLRIANIDNGEFVTAVQRIDPRSNPSVVFSK
jgi:hypothetical protein